MAMNTETSLYIAYYYRQRERDEIFELNRVEVKCLIRKKKKSYCRRQSQQYEIPQFRLQLRVSVAYLFHLLHKPEANPRNQNFLDKIRRTERPKHEHTIVAFQPCNIMLQMLRLPRSPTGLGIYKS
jgi:hypothetical protein